MQTAPKRLAQNMKRIREEKRMSQGDICRSLSCDRAFISNLEAGNSNPTLMTIERVAKALGVASNELLK